MRVAHDERAALRRVQEGEGDSDAGAPRATAAPKRNSRPDHSTQAGGGGGGAEAFD